MTRIRDIAPAAAAVRAALRDHPKLPNAVRDIAAAVDLPQPVVRKYLEESVLDVLDVLGTTYVREMSSVVSRMTQLRERVHSIYERVLTGADPALDTGLLRSTFEELHSAVDELADPETWARRKAAQRAADPAAAGPQTVQPVTSEPAVSGPAVSASAISEPAVSEPAAGQQTAAATAATGTARTPGKARAPRKRLKDIGEADRARVDELRRAAGAEAAAIREAGLRTPEGLPPGWDYAKYPHGPTSDWQPGDPVNMPDGAGNHPAWDTIRKRAWRTKATDELAARAAGTSTAADRLIHIDPIGELTDGELEDVAETGRMPRRVGAEIEHKRIPQRMGRLLVEAGLDPSEARELTKVGDPTNLEPTQKEWHAIVDRRAREINPGRNPTLEISLDERVEFPLGSATNEELAAIVDRLAEREVDLGATKAGQDLREILRAEKERRGASATWSVP